MVKDTLEKKKDKFKNAETVIELINIGRQGKGVIDEFTLYR